MQLTSRWDAVYQDTDGLLQLPSSSQKTNVPWVQNICKVPFKIFFLDFSFLLSFFLYLTKFLYLTVKKHITQLPESSWSL